MRKLQIIVIFLLIGCVWFGCQNNDALVTNPTPAAQSEALAKSAPDIARVLSIQERYTENFLKINNVIGTATAQMEDGRFCVKILAKETVGAGKIPVTVENIPVMIEIIGDVRPEDVYTDRYRPVKAGVSGGSFEYYRSNQLGYIYDGGTIGCVVEKNGNRYFLSNNHVFAHSNRRKIGDGIVQPALIDVGGVQNPDNIVATLSAFKRIKWRPLKNSNVIDAAIAEILPGIDFSSQMICGYTPDANPATASLGMEVKKCGRTTGLTYGVVTGINVTILVNYMPDGYARFDHQIQFSRMSESGDSGSLVVSASGNHPVALHFAGSSDTSFGNPIQEVLNYFGVSICTD